MSVMFPQQQSAGSLVSAVLLSNLAARGPEGKIVQGHLDNITTEQMEICQKSIDKLNDQWKLTRDQLIAAKVPTTDLQYTAAQAQFEKDVAPWRKRLDYLANLAR